MPTSSLPGLLPLEAAIQSVSMFFFFLARPPQTGLQPRSPVPSPPPTPDTSYPGLRKEFSIPYGSADPGWSQWLFPDFRSAEGPPAGPSAPFSGI